MPTPVDVFKLVGAPVSWLAELLRGADFSERIELRYLVVAGI